MRKIVSYVIENSNQLLFFLLLGFSFFISIQHHSYYRSQVVGSVNGFSGGVAQKMYDFESYLDLDRENKMLHHDNLLLKQQLLNLSHSKRTAEQNAISEELFCVYSCDVVSNSFNSYKNYMLLNIGYTDGVKEDMGVFNSKGVIGVVKKTSENYASAASLLHSKTEINAIIKGSDHFGTLKWDGEDYRYMQLIDVPSVADIKLGDSIVTGGMSAIFPENIPIGVISSLNKEKNSNYYVIQVKLHNDMTNLGHAYVIYHNRRDEIQQLEKELEQ